MIKDLNDATFYIDLTLRQGLVAKLASVEGNEENFVTYRNKIIDSGNTLSDLINTMETAKVTVSADFKTWVSNLAEINNDLSLATNACNALSGGTYTWIELRSALDVLINLNEVWINDTKYPDFSMDNAGDLLDRIPPQVLEYGLKQKLAVTVGSVEAMQAAVENGAEYVYLNTTALRKEKAIVPEQYAALAKWCHSRNAKLYWTVSPIENDTQMKKAAANMWAAKDAGFDGVAVGNLGLLQTAKEQGWDTIVADYQMNIFNDVTLQFLSRQEISRAVLSPELSLEQIAEFSYLGNLPLELIVHGNLPLMVSEQCVCGSVLGGRTAQKQCSMPCMKEQYALKDRTGAQFPLYMDEHCRMHVFNSKTLNLYKRLEEALKTGADVLRIEGRERSAEWIGTVTAIYKKAIDTYNQTGSLITDITAMQSLEGLAPEGSTYGHYFRGVL